MLRPGVHVNRRAARTTRGFPSLTGTAFIVGLAGDGPVEPVEIANLDAYERRFGGRVHYGLTHESVEALLADGGYRVFVSRVVGPAAVASSVVLSDKAGTPAETLRIEAWNVGVAGDALSVTVVDNGADATFDLRVSQDGNLVEVWPDLDSPTAAVLTLRQSQYVRAVDLSSPTDEPDNNPAAVVDAALAGGDDDRANVTTESWEVALDRFDTDLGPGQVLAPGMTTLAVHELLIGHAEERNRFAILDLVDGVEPVAAVAAAAEYNSNVAMAVAGWLFSPDGRVYPGSVLAAAKIAAADGATGTAGVAAAGERGRSTWAVDVSRLYQAAEVAEMFEGGVNAIRSHYTHGIQLYGFESLAKGQARDDWGQATAGRLAMSIEHRADGAGERRIFEPLTPVTFARFEAELLSLLAGDWEAGALTVKFGEDPDDPTSAFSVDVGPNVNTLESIQNREIRAAIFARFAPHGSLVRIDMTKLPVE